MGGSVLTRRLSDGCCLTLSHLCALVLAPLLAAALAPLLLPLGEMQPEAARVALPRVPSNFTIEVLTAGNDGRFPVGMIRERFTQRNLPVVLRPQRRACGSSSGSASGGGGGSTGSASATLNRLSARKIEVRVAPQHAMAGAVPLSALVFGSAERAASEGFYQSALQAWRDFVADTPLPGFPHETGCACYAARVSVVDDAPELGSLFQLPTTAHPLSATVGDPVTYAPVVYASHGRGESTPIHFDEEENWLYVLRGTKRVVLYEPHAATHGHLPRHEVYRSTSTVPPHTVEERAAVENAWPSLRGARPVYLTLEAGDALYIPAFWWHGLIAVASGVSAAGDDTCAGSVLHGAGAAASAADLAAADLAAAAVAAGPAVVSVAYWSEPSVGKFRRSRRKADPTAGAEGGLDRE